MLGPFGIPCLSLSFFSKFQRWALPSLNGLVRVRNTTTKIKKIKRNMKTKKTNGGIAGKSFTLRMYYIEYSLIYIYIYIQKKIYNLSLSPSPRNP